MLDEQKIAEIRDAVDLVALISEYVPLRRQGTRFVGLCPFHSEKTPSFGVSRGKNFYHCFGCHESGDAIKFIRHVEGLSFPEALSKLAERVGIDLPHSDDPAQAAQARARAERERLAEVMGVAQAFFEEQLRAHPHAAIARAEIDKRSIRPEIAHKFHLGYAPSGWDGLASYFAQNRIDAHLAVEVGLIAVRRQGNGHYDRFRHRLMFPVADQHGRIIAFSGRALEPPPGEASDDSVKPAKYINSPESALYRKGQALFGIHAARVAIRKQNQTLLCEGNFDLLAIHQAGFENVLAPLGTAFTAEQAKLIRRFAEEVLVVFDGDSAGQAATRGAYALLEQAGLRGRVVCLPRGDDPDTYLRREGPEMFRQLVDNAAPMLDFLIDDAAASATDPQSRGQAIQELGPLLARIQSPIEKNAYVERVARKFEIRNLAAVKSELSRGVLEQRRVSEAQKSGARDHSSLARGTARFDKPNMRADGTRSAEPVSRPTTTSSPPLRKPEDLPRRQCDVLGALLDCPSLFALSEARELDGLLTDPDLRAIFRVTAQMVESRGEVDAPALLDGVSGNPARSWLSKRLSESPLLSQEQASEVIRSAIPWLEKDRRQAERAALRKQIEAATRTGDMERARELTRLRDELLKS